MNDFNIWVEKYRPKNFDDIFGHNKIIERLKAFVKQKNMPHLLLAGPAGVGKTSAALIIVKELFGESWQNNFLELNASDSRGIDVIRGEVKSFARTKAIGDAPYKIIYLDECDSLTKEAQQALRRTMELYSNSCRFILSCNYSSKIIDPIMSRCAVFRFRSLERRDIEKIIDSISKNEKIKIDKKAIDALIEVSEGDVRKLTNILQSCVATTKNMTEDVVYEIVGAAKPKELKDALDVAVKGDFVKARDKLLDTMLKYGLSGLDVVKQIERLIWDLDINNEDKIRLVERCGEIEFRMVEGSDEYLQLEALLASFVVIKK